jgi:hypothetical protein
MWCHQIYAAAGKMDVCGYSRQTRGLLPRVVFEFSVGSTVKHPQLFAYVNNLDAQLAENQWLCMLGVVVVIGDSPTICLSAYYKVADGSGRYKLACVWLYEAIWNPDSLSRVLGAINVWMATDDVVTGNDGTPASVPSSNRRNVLIDGDYIFKIFDYRFRQVDIINRRKHDVSLSRLPEVSVFFKTTDFVVLRYKYVEGDHLPTSSAQVVAVLRNLQDLHQKVIAHGDVRASNVVFAAEPSNSCLIDFDYSGEESQALVYPKGFCRDVNDGKRHEDAVEGSPILRTHDCFSLAYILSLCTAREASSSSASSAAASSSIPVCETVWNTVVESVQNGELTTAIATLSKHTFRLTITHTVSVEDGTGSPLLGGDDNRKRGERSISPLPSSSLPRPAKRAKMSGNL